MEIILLPIAVDVEKMDSRYRLVIVASQRARQMMEGSPPKIHTRYRKATTISLEELAEGKTEFHTGQDARQAQREARWNREEEARRQVLQAREKDIAGEIKRELSVYVDDPHPDKGLSKRTDEPESQNKMGAG